jgi:hypothetical protein
MRHHGRQRPGPGESSFKLGTGQKRELPVPVPERHLPLSHTEPTKGRVNLGVHWGWSAPSE